MSEVHESRARVDPEKRIRQEILGPSLPQSLGKELIMRAPPFGQAARGRRRMSAGAHWAGASSCGKARRAALWAL